MYRIRNKSAENGRRRQHGPDKGKGGRPLRAVGLPRRSLTVRLEDEARYFLELQQDGDYPSLSEILNRILLRLANGEPLDHLKRPKLRKKQEDDL